VCQLGSQVSFHQNMSVDSLDVEGRVDIHRATRLALQPVARSRLPQYRLPSVHPADGGTGRFPRRALGRFWQDRMRFARVNHGQHSKGMGGAERWCTSCPTEARWSTDGLKKRASGRAWNTRWNWTTWRCRIWSSSPTAPSVR